MIPKDVSSGVGEQEVPGNTPAAPASPYACSYLLSAQQSSPPVHVILRFDHVHHLIGVQFEFTLQLVQALHVLHGLLAVSLLPFLLLLLSTTLTLTDPPQIPANQRNPLGISARPLTLTVNGAGGSVLAPQKPGQQLGAQPPTAVIQAQTPSTGQPTGFIFPLKLQLLHNQLPVPDRAKASVRVLQYETDLLLCSLWPHTAHRVVLTAQLRHSPWQEDWLLGQVLSELRGGRIRVDVPLHIV